MYKDEIQTKKKKSKTRKINAITLNKLNYGNQPTSNEKRSVFMKQLQK